MTEATAPSENSKKSNLSIKRILGLAGIGFEVLLIEQVAENFYPGLRQAVETVGYALLCTGVFGIGTAVVKSTIMPMIDEVRQFKKARREYYKEHPEEDPLLKRQKKNQERIAKIDKRRELDEAEKEMEEELKFSIENDIQLLSLEVALQDAKKAGNKKLIKHYKQLIKNRSGEIRGY